MLKGILVKTGGAIMTLALFVLGITVPSTHWIDENRAVYLSFVAFIALAVGILIYLLGVKITKDGERAKAPSSIAPMLGKLDLILREAVISESKKPIGVDELPKLAEAVIKINTGILNLSKTKSPTDKETVRRQVQSNQSRMAKQFSILTKSDRFKVMDVASGILDQEGFGLKEFRSKGKYKRLMDKLTRFRVFLTEPKVNELIKDHIYKSESANAMSLYKEKVKNLKGSVGDEKVGVLEFIHPKLLSNIEHFERDMREELTDTQVKINKLLKQKGDK